MMQTIKDFLDTTAGAALAGSALAFVVVGIPLFYLALTA